MGDGSFKDNFVKVGALWVTKSGRGYSGRLEVAVPVGTRLVITRNSYKEKGDKKPDLEIYAAKDTLGATAPVQDDKGFINNDGGGEDPSLPF